MGSSAFEITRNRPWDHPWHRGLWFSWKYINGINFWNENPRAGEPPGRVDVESSKVTSTPSSGTSVELLLTWRDKVGKDLLAERRTLEMGRVESGCYWITWNSEFPALAGVELSRTLRAHEPSGYPHGGYAGLCLRVVPSQSFPDCLSDGVSQGPELRGRRSSWLQLASPSAEVVIMQHPENRDAPNPWHIFARSDYGPGMAVNPAPLFDGSWHLSEGEWLRCHRLE